jgi:hypothetical protein
MANNESMTPELSELIDFAVGTVRRQEQAEKRRREEFQAKVEQEYQASLVKFLREVAEDVIPDALHRYIHHTAVTKDLNSGSRYMVGEGQIENLNINAPGLSWITVTFEREVRAMEPNTPWRMTKIKVSDLGWCEVGVFTDWPHAIAKARAVFKIKKQDELWEKTQAEIEQMGRANVEEREDQETIG